MASAHFIGAFAIGLEARRQLARMSADQFLRMPAAHDADRGRIDFQQFVFIMQHHAVARAFEQRAEFRFGFAQGLLGALAFGVVHDAGANQILALGRQAQQPDFRGNQTAVGLPMNPFEHRHSPRQRFRHQFAGEFVGTAPIRLKFRADVGGRQFGEPFHRHAVQPARVFIAEEEPAGVAVKNHNRIRSMLDQRAKTRFARRERGRAFVDAALQRLVQSARFRLGLFALRNVACNRHIKLASILDDLRARDFERNFMAVHVASDPFEPIAFMFFDQRNDLYRPFVAGNAVWLNRRREL